MILTGISMVLKWRFVFRRVYEMSKLLVGLRSCGNRLKKMFVPPVSCLSAVLAGRCLIKVHDDRAVVGSHDVAKDSRFIQSWSE